MMDSKAFRFACWIIVIFLIIYLGSLVNFIFRPIAVLFQTLFAPIVIALLFAKTVRQYFKQKDTSRHIHTYCLPCSNRISYCRNSLHRTNHSKSNNDLCEQRATVCEYNARVLYEFTRTTSFSKLT